MSEAIAFRFRCTNCHGALTLHMKDWHTVPPGVERDNVMVKQLVTCPHCLRVDPIVLPGTITQVTKGHVFD